jgi:type II secretory pathway component GspD/PulD (secretin)
VGFLFKTRTKKDNRIELLVMITPKIIDNALAMR